MVSSIHERVKLNNGVEMPWLGLGVFRASEDGEVQQAIKWAAEAGYRSIDTAKVYDNEAGVGQAVRATGVPRDEFFITTKVWNDDQGYDSTLRAFDASVERLGMDYVDLYLVHWPVAGKYKDTWRAMERIENEGRARSIGVSNFMQDHLEDLLGSAQSVPAMNQIEYHPHLALPELIDYCLERDIRPEAWSPIMRGEVFDIPELKEIGAAHGKNAAQVVLRWDIQHGVVTIPKSSKKAHIESNADIFDFELSQDEMNAIDALNRNRRIGPDPYNF
jgi:diketogulonate reductase-like aldo/keto reductase